MNKDGIGKKAVAFGVSLLLAGGLCPGAALAASGTSWPGDWLAPGISTAVQPSAGDLLAAGQPSVADLIAAASAASGALPDLSKVSLGDSAQLAAALSAVAKASQAAFGSSADLTDAQKAAVTDAVEKYQDVEAAFEKLIDSETAATQAKKVKSVKARAGKRKAVVSWKALGDNYRYEVFCSKKKSKGFKKVASTAKTKVTVAKLAKGKRYYFKVRGVRTDIPEKPGSLAFKTVYTKFSAVAASKAVK